MDTRRFVIDDRPRPGRARTAHRPRALPAVRAGVDHVGPRRGIRDATTIWFAYAVGREVRIIDYDKASGVGLGHCARAIVSRPYVWAGHIMARRAPVSSTAEAFRYLAMTRDGKANRGARSANGSRIRRRAWRDRTQRVRNVCALSRYSGCRWEFPGVFPPLRRSRGTAAP